MTLKKKLILFGIVLLVLPLVSSSCLFSTYKANDTHIGQCGYYSNEITFDGTVNLVFGDCPSDQNFIFSLKQPNNTHISRTEGYYNWSLCSSDIFCGITSPCDNVALGSLYRTDDSHWGEERFYANTLCCMTFPISEGAIGGGGSVVNIEEPEIEVPKITIRVMAKEINKLTILIFIIFFVDTGLLLRYFSIK